MEPRTNFISKFFLILLDTAGCPLPGAQNFRFFNFWKYYLIYSFSSVTFGQLLMIRYVTSLNDVYMAVSFIASGLFFNSTTLALHLKKRNLSDVFRAISSDLVVFSSAEERSASGEFRKFFFTRGVVYMAIYTLSLLSSALLFPFSDKELGDVNALLVPCVFPWQIDSYLKFFLTVLLQVSWLLPLSVPVLLNFMFCVYFIFEVRTQFKILRKSLNSEKFEDDSEERLLRSFKRLIRHYQEIVRRVPKNFRLSRKLVV